jgi:serine/threonine-protein kinase
VTPLRDNVFKPGDRVDGYTIVKLRERGGMSEIYDAVGDHAGERVILKCVQRVLIARDDVLERIKEESKVCARLRHPNIVPMFRAGVVHVPLADGSGGLAGSQRAAVPYLIMEPIDGVTLERMIAQTEDRGSTLPRLPLEAVLDIMIQLCGAVSFMHKKRIIHRDLKPSNIMIGEEGHVWVLDFGLAKFAVRGLDSSELPAMGTLGYMAPEQLMPGKKLPVDSRVDIWALGTILYVLIAGFNPFQADLDSTDSERIAANLHGDPQSLLELIPSCPAPLWMIVARCLRRNREERYPNADELLADLRVEARRPLQSARLVEAPKDRVLEAPVVQRETLPASPDFQARDPLAHFRKVELSDWRRLLPAPTAPLARDFRPQSPYALHGAAPTAQIPRQAAVQAARLPSAVVEPQRTLSPSTPSSGVRIRSEEPTTLPSAGTLLAVPPPMKSTSPFPWPLALLAGLMLATIGMAAWFFVSSFSRPPAVLPAQESPSALASASVAPTVIASVEPAPAASASASTAPPPVVPARPKATPATPAPAQPKATPATPAPAQPKAAPTTPAPARPKATKPPSPIDIF